MDTNTTQSTNHPSSSPSTTENDPKTLPIIDISPLVTDHPNPDSLQQCVNSIGNACRTWGFFYITNHGVSEEMQENFVTLTKQFFALPLEEKMKVQVNAKEKEWYGYIPMNAEVTDGKPDLKEGFNMLSDLPSTDPRIQNGLPMFSTNQWPPQLPEFKKAAIEYMEALKKVGYSVTKGIALSLGLPEDFFAKEYLKDPTMLLNAVNYPPDAQANKGGEPTFGIGEHSDYGLLTILKQDSIGGLQVRSRQHGWTDAKPIEGTFVCNLGDMLQLVTNGLYLSTPHRVHNTCTGKNRLSFPFFFEPTWDAEVKPLPLEHLKGHEEKNVKEEEYKPEFKKSIDNFRGKYLDYLLAKMEARYGLV